MERPSLLGYKLSLHGYIFSPNGYILSLCGFFFKALCADIIVVSAGTEVRLLGKHGGHSFGQLISFSLVEAEDGWSRIPFF